MVRDTRPLILGYSCAVVTVALAVLLTLLLQPHSQASIYSLSFVAVIVTAWYGGLGPGLLATALAGLAIDYFFVGSPHALEFDPAHFQQVGVFMLVAILIGYLTAARRQAEAGLRKAHSELEIRVQERTADLARANKQLQAEIVERKEAEAQLAQVTEELIERNKELWRLQGEIGRVERLASLGRITGIIAHELGTPLNSVLGYTQLLAQDELSANGRRRLKIIEAQVQRMIDIISHHLSRTRDSLQKRVHINVNELVLETIELLKPIFHQHEVRVATQLAETLPPLNGDAASLQRVLINLLDNAVDATRAGGLVTISTRAGVSLDNNGPAINIEITDTGGGISPELLPRVFDLFFTTKSAGKGTGLGLAICQEIVKAHGGSIKVKSRLGEGTQVQIELPVNEQDLVLPVVGLG